ncbi:CRISPR-associated endonuclease Cas2 [Lederbergia sp. NSJ-179]|uniref:CRISPR-associated endonuclease Cas2 n=1 Tax=Lederbergia sp. NSJ-179 TaxID=2931402 RepID=UPI001FD56A6D|nr:CRISPR-associated endonuclease Cas2 [Lederbergia sp. NSJ-179]MCJ7840935.1 CRISPR-associated endonuclease Cas2 [Lederbergia sp. NSJ-179]
MKKSKQINANYAFVLYDVHEKRVHKVFKVCKKYLTHHQNSVFRGAITPSNIMKMRKEIEAIIEKDYDFVSIITMMNEHAFTEITLGTSLKADGEALFL